MLLFAGRVQKKGTLFQSIACLLCVFDCGLNDCHIHRGRTFFPIFYVKGYPVAFIQRLETGSIDSGMMDKYIRAIFLFDETIAFFVAKPHQI